MSFQAIQAMENLESPSKDKVIDEEEDFFVRLLDDPNYEGLTDEEKRSLAAEAQLD